MNEVKKIELTPNQVKAIYEAGYNQGRGDEIGYQWGDDPYDTYSENLVSSIAEILEITVAQTAEALKFK